MIEDRNGLTVIGKLKIRDNEVLDGQLELNKFFLQDFAFRANLNHTIFQFKILFLEIKMIMVDQEDI